MTTLLTVLALVCVVIAIKQLAIRRNPVNDNGVAARIRRYLSREVTDLRCTATIRPDVDYTSKTNVLVDLSCRWGADADAATVTLLVWDSGSIAEARAGLANSRTVKPNEIVSGDGTIGDDSFMRRTTRGDEERSSLLFCFRRTTVYVHGSPEAAVTLAGRCILRALTTPNREPT